MNTLLSVEEVRLLIPSMTRKNFSYHLNAGHLPKPSLRIGRKLYWSKELIDQWIAGQQVELSNIPSEVMGV